MPEPVDGRAARYRRQAEHFQTLAKMEQQPRARARLLELADEYRQLAARGPQKPSAELLGAGTRGRGYGSAGG
jgi:hypothetical protein